LEVLGTYFIFLFYFPHILRQTLKS